MFVGNHLPADTTAIVIFFIRIYFRSISRLKCAKSYEYFKNKPEAVILEKNIVLCNTIQLYVFN